MGDLDLDAMRSIQLTVGVLSHNVLRGACLACGAFSNAMPTANTSAVSSRSELVIFPAELSSKITSVAMLMGNPARQTCGGISSTSENHTPPVPSAAAL